MNVSGGVELRSSISLLNNNSWTSHLVIGLCTIAFWAICGWHVNAGRALVEKEGKHHNEWMNESSEDLFCCSTLRQVDIAW